MENVTKKVFKWKTQVNSNKAKKLKSTIGKVLRKDDKEKFFKPLDLDIDSFEKWEKNESYQKYFNEYIKEKITYYCDRNIRD